MAGGVWIFALALLGLPPSQPTMKSATCPFPVPPAGTLGSFCERVFAYRAETPCVRGNHSSLCIALPTRRLSREEYEQKVARLKEPQVRVQIIDNHIYIVKSSMPKIGSKVRRSGRPPRAFFSCRQFRGSGLSGRSTPPRRATHACAPPFRASPGLLARSTTASSSATCGTSRAPPACTRCPTSTL